MVAIASCPDIGQYQCRLRQVGTKANVACFVLVAFLGAHSPPWPEKPLYFWIWPNNSNSLFLAIKQPRLVIFMRQLALLYPPKSLECMSILGVYKNHCGVCWCVLLCALVCVPYYYCVSNNNNNNQKASHATPSMLRDTRRQGSDPSRPMRTGVRR